MEQDFAQDFAAAMARLGPFGPSPRLALAVSGGADSMALAELTRDWAAATGATLTALIADHGLRAGATAEAALAASRLAQCGMAARVIPLHCTPGPALQERARVARHAALAQAARQAGAVFLLLGHHAGDQAETVAMRARRGPGGAEGMAAWTARHDVILLRPLLAMAPASLKTFLRSREIAWLEDPSNADPRFERARLRAAGTPDRPPADSTARRAAEHAAARFIATHVTLRPEGYAVVAAAAAPAPALAALLRMVGGQDHAPRRASVAPLAARLRPATLGGVRIIHTPAGWLLAREPAACAPPVPAATGVLWDHRFRLAAAAAGTFGALGADAPAFRKTSGLPAVVLRGLPCLRPACGGIIFPAPAVFTPPAPATSHPFLA